MRQTSEYFADSHVHNGAIARVTDLVDAGTKAIMGHSLGSIVAYEAALQLSHPMHLLLTLGSPLGLKTIQDRLAQQPPIYPPRVVRWVNVAAEDDVVAAEADLSASFPAMPPTVASESISIDSGSQPYSANRYLANPIVGRLVAEALGL